MSLDHESQNAYSVRVQVKDRVGEVYEKILTVQTIDQNDAPTGITLDNSTIAEGQKKGTLIGTLGAVDQDASAGDKFSYTLVSGVGDSDNASFKISGAELKSEQSFDVAQRDKLYIRLRVTDSAGEFHEEPMIVQVTTVNDAPTGIALEVDTIAENSPEDTLVSAIVVTDPDEFSIAGVGEGLLAHYKFDGDITDSSGNGHDASFVSMNSADSFVDGQVLQAIRFTPSNGYLDLPVGAHPPEGQDQYSLAFWSKWGSTAGARDSSVLESGDGLSSNPRVLNIHFPWSNGYVYWDSYKAGSSNRIKKVCSCRTSKGAMASLGIGS